MTDAPETIWAWNFISSKQEEGIVRGGWDDNFDRKATQYTRSDIATKPEWHPIETAPKDGVTLLGYCPHDDNYPDMKSIYAIRFNDNKYAAGWYLQTTDGDDFSVDPTHWMPLPAAPALVTQGEE